MTSLLSGPSMPASTHSTRRTALDTWRATASSLPLFPIPDLQMDGTSPLLHRGHQVWTVEYRSLGPAPTKPYTLLLASDPVPIASGSRSFLLAQCRVATHRIACNCSYLINRICSPMNGLGLHSQPYISSFSTTRVASRYVVYTWSDGPCSRRTIGCFLLVSATQRTVPRGCG